MIIGLLLRKFNITVIFVVRCHGRNLQFKISKSTKILCLSPGPKTNGGAPNLKRAIITVMADTISKSERSRVMAAVRSTGNKATELALVKMFRRAGITGWRRHPLMPGRPDFAFPKQRIVVFVDGCFWHGCPSHCRMPQSNRTYWQTKIARNAIRDRQTTRLLRAKGWTVIRIWGHSLLAPARALKKINSELRCAAEAYKHFGDNNEQHRKDRR
jgi:DNA mismatch endonuclease, patch repair protein